MAVDSRRVEGGAAAVPLPPQLVALYGRQVLEAMTYLAGTGVPTVHVHAGTRENKVGDRRH